LVYGLSPAADRLMARLAASVQMNGAAYCRRPSSGANPQDSSLPRPTADLRQDIQRVVAEEAHLVTVSSSEEIAESRSSPC
jgi:hypothetical protein